MKIFSGKIAIFFIIVLLGFQLKAQNKQGYFQGFAKEISGKRFTYQSPIPTITASLLVRGNADYESIVWETEKIPNDYQGDFVNFMIVFGRDVVGKPAKFHLFVNDKEYFSFESDRKSKTGIQSVEGKDGAQLIFNITMLDKYKDQMGFATIKLPTSAIIKGQAAQIKISAEADNNSAWFMLYKTPIRESINIKQNKVVMKSEGELLHSISIDFVHIGKNTPVNVKIGDQTWETELKMGFNRLDIALPKVDKETEFSAFIHFSLPLQEIIKIDFTLSPVKEWEIYLVQHTHTDIGYTRPQPEILNEHLRYIDHALDYCDLTDDYPDASKFRWTCETSWSVREYLKNRPKAQIDRLLNRMQEGRMEATGMFFNFSEVIDESALAAQTKTLKMLKDAGIDVTTIMQNDVNGVAWCLVDYFQHTDVKYLTMGIHAHRARKPFNKPTTFWWQSPAGNRLLAYRSEHYQYANSLGIHTHNQDGFRDNLSIYLSSLEEKGYPYDRVALQFSGYVVDNSPPSVEVCDIIKAWNEKYEWPKLRSSLARDFMLYIDENHSDEIEEKQVAWPDWWTDGVASAAKETKVSRNVHAEASANTALLSISKMMGVQLQDNVQEKITALYDDLLFYDEHTFGAAESVRDPLAENTINQWGVKSSYVWDAWKKSAALQEDTWAAMQAFLPKLKSPSIIVMNTLNWKRSGLIHLFIENTIIPEGSDFVITDIKGNKVPVQEYERRPEGAYYGLWVSDIPPMGFSTFLIHTGRKTKKSSEKTINQLDNEYYSINIDKNKGVVTSIFDKQLQTELVDKNDSLTLGEVIYEQLDNRHEMERLTASNRDTVYKPLGLKRSYLSNIKTIKYENGPIYQSLILNGQLPVCADERGVDIEIRLYHYEKKIEFHYRMFKLAVTTPESVYVSFPFRLEGGKLFYEAQGGLVSPGVNQLEGSSSDWNAIQNFAAVRNMDAQIVFSSKDIPLVQFGDINIGRYYYRLKPKTNYIFSWVLNNYWVTNFKASQEGELRWKYAITSSDNRSNSFASRFGWGDRAPLLSRVIWPNTTADDSKAVSKSFIDLKSPQLLLVNTTPSLDGKGIILQIRELEGSHVHLDINDLLLQTGASAAYKVNILEEEISPLSGEIHINDYATIFIKFVL